MIREFYKGLWISVIPEPVVGIITGLAGLQANGNPAFPSHAFWNGEGEGQCAARTTGDGVHLDPVDSQCPIRIHQHVKSIILGEVAGDYGY